MDRLDEVLAGNRYPGRGVLWARTLDGTLCGGYFLTGRGPASRARELRPDVDELIVRPTTGQAGEHDPLRHYVAARERSGRLVYGNGEQVAVVADRLEDGLAPTAALGDLAYEPDPPIHTPRLTVIVIEGTAWFGSARRSPSGRTTPDVSTLAVGGLGVGDVVLATTYRSDGIRIATGEPYLEARTDAVDPEAFLAQVWGALTPPLRVAAAVFEAGRLGEAVVVHEGRPVGR
jgi:IMP cyclohydrolase